MNNPISPATIENDTNGKFSVVYVKSCPSTNMELKALAQQGAKEGTVLISEHQTMGRGRLGKTFFSPEKNGIYFSVLLRPRLAAKDAVFITVAAAVSVRRAIKKLLGVSSDIKWVNDLYFGGKKFCGILTEAGIDAASGALSYAVLGIGINLTEPKNGYPEEFSFKTTNLASLTDAFPEDFKNKLIACILNEFYAFYQNLEKKEYLKEYKSASCVIGKEIKILSLLHNESATAIDIDENANLVVRFSSGEVCSLSSGDVSIHF